ncbi:MAG: putative salt-induced outer membrane protein [Candidatus Omnitrophota bacterium]|jgi:putative salt-induced outer membrane protein
MNKYVLIALATSLGLAWSAQAGWESVVNAGANLTEGNSETSAYSAGLASKNTNSVDQLYFNLSGAYGENAGATTTENVTSSADYRKVLNDPMYGYLNASFLYDSIAQIDSRFIIGPGVGTKLIDNGRYVLGLEVGAAYITESLGVDTAVEIDDIALRVGQYYTRTLSPTAHVWQKLEYLPLFNHFDDYLLNAEVGIETVIVGGTSLRIVANDRYDSTPATSEENDLAVTAGLSFAL